MTTKTQTPQYIYIIAEWNYKTEEWEFDSVWDTRKEARENSEILTKSKVLKTLHVETECLAAITRLNVNYYGKQVARYRKRVSANEAKLDQYAERLSQLTKELKLINGKRSLKQATGGWQVF
jgi:hypothetical protein